jgi:MFS transporter, DHA2 family, glioxin efflux transporter
MFGSGAQSVFANRLLATLVTNAPQIDASEVLAVGATELQSRLSSAELVGIRESYMEGFERCFRIWNSSSWRSVSG